MKALLPLSPTLLDLAGTASAADVRVLVWDERQPRQKERGARSCDTTSRGARSRSAEDPTLGGQLRSS